MKITDLLNINSIDLNPNIKDKKDAIDKLVELMDKGNNLIDKEAYKEKVLERESHSTTGIGEGIAIPHAKTKSVKKAGLSLIITKKGVDYESLDGEPANILFMIAAPEEGSDVHIDVLVKLSGMLMDKEFKNSLLQATSKDDVIKAINLAEGEKDEEKNDKKSKEENSNGYEILAVTACPTGIAHTFMAAEALENKAKELGVSIKVETNGSSGAKNVLTKEEIDNAKCIIVAADKKVEMARFDGKKVIQTKVANGIHKATELINDARDGKGAVYHHASSSDSIAESSSDESAFRKIYKHLMNGVSHMLPFVIGGGILIALAFLFDDYNIDPSNFGKNTPFAKFLKTIGEQAFGFMLPVLAGYIAQSIGDRPALAVGFVGGMLANIGGSGFLGALLAGFIAGYLTLALGKIFSRLPNSLEGIKPVLLYPFFGILLIGSIIMIIVNPPVSWLNNSIVGILNGMGDTSKVLLGAILGGMMALDMGGPINKAAYVFGTASIESGNFDIMAAVMIGGMVPPLAIALATTIFKNKFTKKERQSGITNYVMGLSFITEGAIPFAASDPIRVIPACTIGSAVAGGLSMLFNCGLRAPHGGIFVFPVVSNALMYIVALVVGSIVGMVILGLLKKKVK